MPPLGLLAALLCSPTAAAAQAEPPPGPPPPPPLQIAVEPPPEPLPIPPPPPPPPEPVRHRRYGPGRNADGMRVTAGRAFTEDIADGWFGRLEVESIWAGARHAASGIGGVTLGVAGWGSSDGGGGSLPMTFWGGFHSPIVTTTVGLGWDWALYDRIRDDGGFGIFAPVATAAIGLDFASVRILADGRAQYRWQWGADDPWQLTLGISIGVYDLGGY
jgi:hypothetical protein